MSIYTLAKCLDRYYRNVHQNVSLLSEWLMIEKNDENKVHVPWDEIDVRPLLPAAA